MAISDESEVLRRMEGKFEAMLICFILGLGSLIALNSLWTMGDYYYKLFPKRYHPLRVFTIIYQPFALSIMLILTHYESRINTRMRNLSGYTLFFVGSLLVLVLDLATSGRGGIGPYIGLCALCACFGIAHASVQGGMVGDLSFMCPEFVQSFVAGIYASGALACALRLVTKASFEKSDNGLRNGASSEGSKTVSADLAAAGIPNGTNQQVGFDANQQERLSNKQLFLQNIDYAVDLFLTAVITLSIIPGFLYEDTGSHKLGTWYQLVLITMYNVMDLTSSYIPLIKCLKLESRKGLLIAALSRLLLVPAFYFTAKYGEQGWMIFLVSFLGLTNGYLTVCVYTVVPKGYKGPEQNALGNLLALWLSSGICAGVALDWLWLIGKSENF
ncbi:equilibrative nucleotide transporter 3-like isoform X3 [Gastrolobium bilobum]|uniref:equilibrative nucleotide transporter 3-like isoform X3 n=1 Tax=Gastrolobium bilobum TaxID=150636 RepID=UPI002AAFD5E9|nr:equilibrative nucleotide transporter 3-like isoform X3 [Gastrolobium bilobum]